MSAVQTLLTDHIDIWTAADTGKRSGRGRASSNAGSVYGIRKLRELILELAVRGKLVPQDANDEPASELLKRTHVANAALIVEGKIKKEKALPLITEDERLFEIPAGWEWVRLNDIGSTYIGLTYSPKDISNSGTPVLRSSNIQNGKIDLIDLVRVDGNLKSSLFVNEGDLLICARNGSKSLVGKTAMIKNLNEPMVFGAFMAIFKSPFNFYVEVFLNSPVFRKFLDGVATTTINQITQDNLKTTLAPLPPISEQHRIVAKVDELMALCDQLETRHSNAVDAHEKLVSHLLGTLTLSQSAQDFSANWQRIAAHFDTLFTTEASIDALKQTLLQMAVMGKLVPQDANDEPASELLKRIQAEKTRLIAEGKIKKDKPLPVITEDERPFDLPNGWEWVRLGTALDITGGVTLGRKLTGADLVELPYLRVANVQRGHLVLDSIKTVEIRQSELSRYQLLKDDLLVTEGGDWDKVGRTAIWNAEIETCLHQNHIFRMRGLIKGLSSSWIEMYMNSIAKTYFQAASKQTTNLASINMTQLKNCLLAVPAIQEQYCIVSKVDELMDLCDQLKSRITESNQLKRKLADMLVEQAVA